MLGLGEAQKLYIFLPQSVRFSYGRYDILFGNQFSGRKTQLAAAEKAKEKIAFKRLTAAKQRRFVRYPYGTFVILLVDSIIQYRLTGKSQKVSITQQSFTFFQTANKKHIRYLSANALPSAGIGKGTGAYQQAVWGLLRQQGHQF